MTNVYGGKIQIVTLADGSVRKLRPEVRLEHPLIFSEDGKNIFFVPYVRNDSQAVKLSFASIRSEEHTSELQSLMRISYAVFCLTKKNKKPTYNLSTSIT